MPRERVAQGSNGPEKLWIAASPWVPIQEIPISEISILEIPIQEIPISEIPILETRGCKGVSVGEIGVSTQISSQLPKTSETPSTTCPQRQLRMVGARMGRNGIMAYPSTPHRATISASASAAGTPLGASSATNSGNGPSQGGAAIRCSHGASSSGPAGSTTSQRGLSEGDHQLEKLEFALAVALTRGDLQRSEQLRHQIDALGGNREEPGT